MAASCRPARQSRRADVLRGRGLSALPPSDRDGGASRGCGDLGLLPDAQSCPSDRDAGGRGWAAATFAEAHWRYTGALNRRVHWTGHLFQGRFGAVVIDEPHLLAATRYIALNPVVRWLRS